ncbi:MAG: DNA polymerase Y family protein [Chromatiales bacterium]|nr:DNA polymerase Y family protein [Chromatiales bacterium]
MTRSPKTQPSEYDAAIPPASHPEWPGSAPPRPVPARLWLCLYLPQLPLEAQASRFGSREPLAICAEEGRHTLVVTVNALASARGVHPGMPVTSALALVPELVFEDRSPALEAVALSRLARWAGRFTPAVIPGPDGALLLEVQGSLRLFNGLEALRATVARELQALGHEARMACAPTARAALWLARAGVGQAVLTSVELRQVLASLPVSQLGWPAHTVRALLQMGLGTVGDCLRLPREGFARRLGPARLRELDQALGRSPEPQRPYVPPARFMARLELPAESADAALLLEGFRQLLQDLEQALESRQAGVRRVWCSLAHPDGAETRLCLALRQPAGPRACHRAGHLAGLLRLRLETLVLPGPVASLAVQADLEPGQAPAGTDLLGQSLRPDDGLQALLERLRARLGGQAVQGLALRAEHRPEHAWRAVADPVAGPGAREPVIGSRSRPVWLLPAPERLRLIAGQPRWQGPLLLEHGPERIESGWWDGGDVRRDYYRASNPRGAVLWVYQDLRSQDWYLHGVFG